MLKKITQSDMQGKGNVGKADTPAVSISEMQRILDELPREVIAPIFNDNIDTLESETAADCIGAKPPDGITADPAPEAGKSAKLSAVLKGIVNFVLETVHTWGFSKQETMDKIDEKVVDVGAGDMAMAFYDPMHKKEPVQFASEPMLATTSKQVPFAINEVNSKAINVYIHTYDPAAHAHTLTGMGDNIKFTAIADYSEGDTFIVNGTAVTAQTQNAEPLDDEYFKTGAVVSCFKNGDVLNFKLGGLSGSKLKLADAQLGDVLEGKTFYAGDKTFKTGTRPTPKLLSFSGLKLPVIPGKHYVFTAIYESAGYDKVSPMQEVLVGAEVLTGFFQWAFQNTSGWMTAIQVGYVKATGNTMYFTHSTGRLGYVWRYMQLD